MGRVGLSRVVAQLFFATLQRRLHATAWTLLPSVLAALGAHSLLRPFLFHTVSEALASPWLSIVPRRV